MDNLFPHLLSMRDKLAARVKAQYPAEPWLSQEDLEHLLGLLQLTIERIPVWTPISTLPPMPHCIPGYPLTAMPLLLMLAHGKILRGYLGKRNDALVVLDDYDNPVFCAQPIVAWVPVVALDAIIRNRPVELSSCGG